MVPEVPSAKCQQLETVVTFPLTIISVSMEDMVFISQVVARAENDFIALVRMVCI